MALLFRDFDKRVEIRSPRDGLIRFRIHAEAAHLLDTYRTRPGLPVALRQVLAENSVGDVEWLADDEVIEEVTRRLLDGSLQLMEMLDPRTQSPVTLDESQDDAAGAEETSIEPAPAEPTPATAPAAGVETAPEEPLLSQLEEVQIEGAEVLPEITQTLEQINLSIDNIDLAAVSLKPAPSGIPAIGTEMQQASSAATSTLESL